MTTSVFGYWFTRSFFIFILSPLSNHKINYELEEKWKRVSFPSLGCFFLNVLQG